MKEIIHSRWVYPQIRNLPKDDQLAGNLIPQ